MRKSILLLVHILTGSILIVSGLIGSGTIINKVILGIIGILYIIALVDHMKEIGIGGVSNE